MDIIFFIVASLALFVAALSLIVSVKAIQYQIIGLLNVQLANKAKECNGNLNPKDLSNMPREDAKVSGIVSSIVTAKEILNSLAYCRKCKKNTKKNPKKISFLVGFDLQRLIDLFYLQLHTTIRVFLKNGKFEEKDFNNKEVYKVINDQLNTSRKFLKIPIDKYKADLLDEKNRDK